MQRGEASVRVSSVQLCVGQRPADLLGAVYGVDGEIRGAVVEQQGDLVLFADFTEELHVVHDQCAVFALFAGDFVGWRAAVHWKEAQVGIKRIVNRCSY